MITKTARVPGVAYSAPKANETFYADFFWALLLNNRIKLDELLSLEKEALSEEFARLSKLPLARKTYSLAAYLVQRDQTSQKNDKTNLKRKIIDWYYHGLSPLTVEWQLDHPHINRLIAMFVELALDVALKLLKIPLLDDEGIYRIKTKLPAYKDMTNYAIYERYYINGRR